MGNVRFFLILLLSVALDFSSPVVPQAMESFGEFEEASHRARMRRVIRLERDPAGPLVRQIPQVHIRPASARRGAPARRSASAVGIRKIPVAIADSSSPPEDH